MYSDSCIVSLRIDIWGDNRREQIAYRGMLKNLRPIIFVLAVLALTTIACGFSSNQIPKTGANQGQLGQIFVASQVDQSGCPLDRASQFQSDEPVYVGVDRSDIPNGTTIFARLLQDGQALEDTKPVTANQDMNNTCVWFQFTPSRNSNGFQPGKYSAQIMVNGNLAAQTNFLVTAGQSSAGINNSNSNNNNANSQVQLGQPVTSTNVDSNGCPTNNVTEFSQDERIYVAYDRSVIPAGTEMFARLLYENNPVEDTQPIHAQRDMRSCVWFIFEASQNAQGLQPGAYQAQIFVNGQMADQIQFDVR